MSLRSLYDEASLWMNPSGYKDGKLYSQKPTDGDGDFTFSRGSNLAATRVDVNGLIEKGRENLLLQSNQFDTTWATPNSSVTSGQSGYDGTSDAWLISTTANGGRVSQSFSSRSGVHRLSIYAKAASSNWLLILANASSNGDVYFDLENGVVGNVGNAAFDAQIESVGGGWYRCSFAGNYSGLFEVRIYPAAEDGDVSGNNSIYIQDAQLEQGLVATDYIETGASTAQAGILEDMPRLDYSGGASCPSLLLEPQRSNISTHSEYFDGWELVEVSNVANATISPEGVENAYTIVDTAVSNRHINYLILSGDRSLSRTFSIYAKQNTLRYLFLSVTSSSDVHCYSAIFDLQDGIISGTNTNGDGTLTSSIESVGNGWYRCIISGTMTSGSASYYPLIGTSDRPDFTGSLVGDNAPLYTGDGSSIYIYGAQLELGSYPTSYIPTYGSSVTRSGETTNTGTSSADEIGQQSGVIFGEFKAQTEGSSSNLLNLSKGSSTGNWIFIGKDSDKIRAYLRVGGVVKFSNTSNSLTGNNQKVALRYESGNSALFIDGVKVATYPSIDYEFTTTLDRVSLGSPYAVAGESANWNQVAIFPTALTDEECVELTINGLKDELIAEYKTRATDLEPGAEARLETYLQELEDFRII